MAARFANKYEQQAHELTRALRKTRWSVALVVEDSRSRDLSELAEAIRMRPLKVTVATFVMSLVAGALWMARR